jgi:SAM-dependent methyltransferase
MEPEAVKDLYDQPYAEAYDQRFLLDAWPKQGAEFELEIIRRCLPKGSRWLDVGCGTGWFLSKVPNVERAGLDLSPAMVARSREANPGASFIEERSFLDDEPSWHGQWDLVTCLWQPYNYVDDVTQVELLLKNMAGWTKPGGAVFIPVVDLEDIRPHVDVPYEVEPDVWGGTIALTSITWTWHEPGTGKVHQHLVAPQAGHFVRVLSTWFRKVEVLRYPPTEPGGVPRKAILATERRGSDDDGADAVVIWHEKPRHPDDVAAQEAQELEEQTPPESVIPPELAAELVENERRWAENNQAWADNERRWAENNQAWAEADAYTRSETARADAAQAEVAGLQAEVERLTAAPASPSQLAGVPTKALARTTLGRLRPRRLVRRVVRRG